MRRQNTESLVLIFALAGFLLGVSPATAQQNTAAVPATAASTAPATPAPAPGELEALVAPIALYPDQLLAKVLIASTYPLEIVEAARWQQQNKTLTGAALDSALAKQSWDDSIKDLVHVPNVLGMMDKEIGWTQKLGDAFLANQADMLQAVQRLRAKAQANGTLKDTEQQKVVTEKETIIIQPTEPEKVYVPYYDPTTAYGAWGYSTYPPYYWPPPAGYYYGRGLAFFTGMAIGAAFWNNGCNWGGGGVYINHNNFNNFNNRTNIGNGNRQNWQHNVNHRRGVGYGNSQLNNRYGRGASAGAGGRRDFRGFDNNNGLGNRGGVGNRNSVANRGGIGTNNGVGGNRGGVGNNNGLGGNRGGVASNNGLGGNRGGGNFSNSSYGRGGGFDGVGRGSQTRSYSSRGNSSFGSARSSGYRGGGSRGGGGMRGGGGRGGGGGRRR